MRLQADPTVPTRWAGTAARIYYSDLRVQSPYNTYLHPGLPPGPIGNPGRASIQAVLNPTPGSRDLFFVARGDGTHIFSETGEQHLEAVARVRASRAGLDSLAHRSTRPRRGRNRHAGARGRHRREESLEPAGRPLIQERSRRNVLGRLRDPAALGSCVVAYSGGVDSSLVLASRTTTRRARPGRDRALRDSYAARELEAGALAGRGLRRRAARGRDHRRARRSALPRTTRRTAATTARASSTSSSRSWRAPRATPPCSTAPSPTTSPTRPGPARGGGAWRALAARRAGLDARPTCARGGALGLCRRRQAGLALPGVAHPVRHRDHPRPSCARSKRGEAWLRELGFRELRVRHHGDRGADRGPGRRPRAPRRPARCARIVSASQGDSASPTSRSTSRDSAPAASTRRCRPLRTIALRCHAHDRRAAPRARETRAGQEWPPPTSRDAKSERRRLRRALRGESASHEPAVALVRAHERPADGGRRGPRRDLGFLAR